MIDISRRTHIKPSKPKNEIEKIEHRVRLSPLSVTTGVGEKDKPDTHTHSSSLGTLMYGKVEISEVKSYDATRIYFPAPLAC